MDKRFLLGFILLASIVAVGVRLLPHMPNFTPVGALALFVGAYLAPKYRWGLLLPLLVMFLSDLFIGFYDLRLMAVVYGSFFAYGVIGMASLREMSRRDTKQKSAATVLLGSVGGAVFFYLATNFAVWAFSPWYSHNLQGLLLSYEMALPFFRFTLLGDVFFSALFFGAYELAQVLFPRLYAYQRDGRLFPMYKSGAGRPPTKWARTKTKPGLGVDN